MFKKMWKVNEKKRKNQNFVLNETLTTLTASCTYYSPLTEIGIVSATSSESSKRFIYSTGVSE